jgi:hypothetical protein
LSDQVFRALIIFLLIIIALIVMFVAGRLMIYGYKAKRFYEEVIEVRDFSFTEKTVEARRKARDKFTAMVKDTVASKNPHLNNPKMAENLIELAKYSVDMSVMGEAEDTAEARRWGENIGELLQPMLVKGKGK